MQKIFQDDDDDGGKKPYKIVGGFRGEIDNVAQRWVGFTGEGDRPNSWGLPRTSHPGWRLILRGG